MLTDGTIVLRAPQLDDVPLVEEATKDAYVVDITSLPEVFSREAALDWLQRQQGRLKEDDGWPFVIVDARTDDRLGFLGAGLQHRGVAQVGYFVLERARGRGVASSALQLFIQWAFNELELVRMQALIEPWNEASIRAAERAGFRREGLLRRYFKRRDVLMYAVLAEDPP